MKTTQHLLLVCTMIFIFSATSGYANGNSTLNNIATVAGAINSTYGDSSDNSSLTCKTFTANVKSNKTVIINWAAAQSQGAKKFIVERSINGRMFYPIGEVASVTSANLRTNYTFTDAAPETGYNYYRLKQVDADGSLSATNVNMIDIDIRNDLHLVDLYNKNVISAQYLSNEEAEVSVEVTNVKGKVIVSKKIITKTGDNLIQISSKDLIKGQYFISVISASDRQTIGFVK